MVPSYNFINKVGSSSPRLGSMTSLEKLLHRTGASNIFPKDWLSPLAPRSYAIWRSMSFFVSPRELLLTALGTWLLAWSHAINHGPLRSVPVVKNGASSVILVTNLVVSGCEICHLEIKW